MGSPSPDPRPGQTSPNGRGAWTNRKAQACLGRTLSAGQDRPARSSPCHDSWYSTGTGSRRRACTPHSCQSFGGTNSSAQTGRRSSCSHRKPRGHTRWRRAGRSSTGRDMDRAGRGWSFAGCSPLSQTGRTCAARARPPGRHAWDGKCGRCTRVELSGIGSTDGSVGIGSTDGSVARVSDSSVP